MGKSENCSNPLKFRKHTKQRRRNILSAELIQAYNDTNPEILLTETRVCTNCMRWISNIANKASEKLVGQKRTADEANLSPQQGPSENVTDSVEDNSIQIGDKCPANVIDIIAPGLRSQPCTSKSKRVHVVGSRFPGILSHKRNQTSSQTLGHSMTPVLHQNPVASHSPVPLEQQHSKESTSDASYSKKTPQSEDHPRAVQKILPASSLSDRLESLDLESLAPSVAYSVESGSVFENTATMLHEANASLTAVGVSPIQSTKIPRKSVKMKYARAKQAIAEKLNISTKCKLPLTPTSNCSWCKQLITDLPKRYDDCTTKQEKYKILTTVPLSTSIFTVHRLFNCSITMAKEVSKYKRIYGPFYCPPIENVERGISKELVLTVINFYTSDDNSRVLAGERNSVMCTQADGTKIRVQKRLILMSLRDLYSEFLESEFNKGIITSKEEPHIGVSKFASLRPRNCAWPGAKGHHHTCLCIIHENFKLLCDVAGLTTNSIEFFNKYLCSGQSDNCFLGYCSECPDYEKIRDDIRFYIGNDEVAYFLWKSTDRTDLVEVRETADDFIDGFSEYLRKFTAHSFITAKQRDFIKELYSLIPLEKSVVVQVDFGMNFTFVSHEEVQSAHFNPPQVTIHPFIVKGRDSRGQNDIEKYYVVLSDDLNHGTNAFQAFRKQIVPLIIRDFTVEHIHYVSDGSAAQYKNFKNLANLYYHLHDFKLTADWHFTATAHGKSTCDAITGVVKRVTRLHSLQPNVVVRNLEHMSAFCKGHFQHSNTIEIVDIKKSFVESVVPELEQRYANACRLVGIKEKHSFVPVNHGVEVRRFSSAKSFEMFFPNGEPDRPIVFNRNVGQFVAFRVGDAYQIGVIKDGDEDNDLLEISCMSRYKNINSFTWPPLEKIESVPLSDILGNVIEPTKSGPTARVSRLLPSEFKKFNEIVRNVRQPERHGAATSSPLLGEIADD